MRVVEDLNFKTVARIVHLRNGIEQAVDDMVFVVEGQLYGDGGQCLEAVRLRGRGRVVPIEEA